MQLTMFVWWANSQFTCASGGRLVENFDVCRQGEGSDGHARSWPCNFYRLNCLNRFVTVSCSSQEQGGCGSCWAVAAIGALEMHAEMVLRKEIGALSSNQVMAV